MLKLKKLIQVTDYLLCLNEGSLNYTKLIKLIYIANREMLKQEGDLIIFDKFVSMPQGPVLSSLYDLIKGDYSDKIIQLEWNTHFIKKNYNLVRNNFKQNNDELSLGEMRILKQVDLDFKDWDWQEIVDNYLHKNELCPEWKDPEGSSYDIHIKDILLGLGYDDIDAKEIEEEIFTYEKEDELFSELS